jgi:hypothetical protein
VDILPEDGADGTYSYCYAFYEQDHTLWECFSIPEQKPFDDIYSKQDGTMHLVRIKSK